MWGWLVRAAPKALKAILVLPAVVEAIKKIVKTVKGAVDDKKKKKEEDDSE
jgi:hypothetical protein